MNYCKWKHQSHIFSPFACAICYLNHFRLIAHAVLCKLFIKEFHLAIPPTLHSVSIGFPNSHILLSLLDSSSLPLCRLCNHSLVGPVFTEKIVSMHPGLRRNILHCVLRVLDTFIIFVNTDLSKLVEGHGQMKSCC